MHFHNILFPYVQKTRSNLKLEMDYPALVIIDQFKGQTATIFQLTSEEYNIYMVEIDTKKLQRLVTTFGCSC